MKPGSFFIGAALVTLPLTATGAGAEAVSTLAARGEALVVRECAMCHAIGSSGSSPMREAPPFGEIAARVDPGVLRNSLQAGILSGHPTMPRLSLAPNDVEAILAYLSSVRGR
jgi:mono/diheme cytochrome c family protein